MAFITPIIPKHKSLWILLSPFLPWAISQVKIRVMNILIFIFLSSTWKDKIFRKEWQQQVFLLFSLLALVHEYSTDLFVWFPNV